MVNMEVDTENINDTNSRIAKKIGLKNLLDRVGIIEENADFGLNAVIEVNQVLQGLDVLEKTYSVHKRLENSDETILDVKLLNSASSVVNKALDSVTSFQSNVYDPREFAEKIISKCNENEDDFHESSLLNLLEDAKTIYHKVPIFASLYGTYTLNKEQIIKKSKPRIEKQSQKTVVKKTLLKVKNVKEDEQSIDDIVDFLLEVLKLNYEKNNNQPILYYRYVIDTDDFGKTVENIFYTSFLIRDGKAKLNLDDNDEPTLEPIHKKYLKAFRNSKGHNIQMISSITMEKWREHSQEIGYLQEVKNNL